LRPHESAHTVAIRRPFLRNRHAVASSVVY
jgi:hypothetical protein